MNIRNDQDPERSVLAAGSMMEPNPTAGAATQSPNRLASYERSACAARAWHQMSLAPEEGRPGERLAFEQFQPSKPPRHTLTNGTFGTEPRGDGGPPSPRDPGGLLRR